MLSYHNDVAVKVKYVARMRAHMAADELVRGVGFEHNGKTRGCAIGCTLDAYDHKRFPAELGLPEWFAHLFDGIFEGLPEARALKFPLQVLRAIPLGVDIEPIKDQLAILRLQRLLPALAANKEGYARECEAAINGVIEFLRKRLAREFTNESAAESAARSAAWSAARSAAWSAAESAAWSAARSAAESAARSAARSAAESAAESAAWSAARSAARSAAESAAESAAWSAAESAAYEWEADTLLSLLRAAK